MGGAILSVLGLNNCAHSWDAELSAIPNCLNEWSQIEVLHEKAVRSSHTAALFLSL